MSVPVFQDFATSSDHAENVRAVTFRALRAHLVWNTRVGRSVPVEQSSVPAFRKRWVVKVSVPVCQNLSAVVNMHVSVPDQCNRHAVLVRIDWVAAFLLFLTHNELADDTRTAVAMVARQNV